MVIISPGNVNFLEKCKKASLSVCWGQANLTDLTGHEKKFHWGRTFRSQSKMYFLLKNHRNQSSPWFETIYIFYNIFSDVTVVGQVLIYISGRMTRVQLIILQRFFFNSK